MHYKRILLLGLMLNLAACTTVPITERSQLNFVPAGTMLSLSQQQYSDFISKNKVISGTTEAQRVERVGRRIQHGVEQYFQSKGKFAELANYKWEFKLVDSKEVNAWCMPGGKVVVYTGILKYAKTDEALATVMGHEIAHAVAGHGSERMSQAIVAQGGLIVVDQLLADRSPEARALTMGALGVGAQVGVLLPYSRLHESEADRLGLIFMAMAGYDPHNAVGFWQAMAKQGGASNTASFLSTHPSDEKRIRAIEAEMPEAMRYYHP